MGVERINVDRRVLLALMLTSTVFFVRDAASSPYAEPWRWTRDSSDAARLAAVDEVPDDAAVRASPALLPLLAERVRLWELDTSGPDPDAPAAVERVDWIIFDADATDWDTLTQQRFGLGLNRLGWEEVFAEEGVFVYRRTPAAERENPG